MICDPDWFEGENILTEPKRKTVKRGRGKFIELKKNSTNKEVEFFLDSLKFGEKELEMKNYTENYNEGMHFSYTKIRGDKFTMNMSRQLKFYLLLDEWPKLKYCLCPFSTLCCNISRLRIYLTDENNKERSDKLK